MGLFDKFKKTETKATKKDHKDAANLKNQLDNIMDLINFYIRNDDYSSAQKQFDCAFDIMKQMECDPLLFDADSLLPLRYIVTLQLSEMYHAKRDFASCLDANLQVKHLTLQLLEFNYPAYREQPEMVNINTIPVIIVNTEIADCYRELGDYENAMKYASEAWAQCAEGVKNIGLSEFADSYFSADMSMAFILCDIDDPEKALKYCRHFLNICEMLPEYLKSDKGKALYRIACKTHDGIIDTGTYK